MTVVDRTSGLMGKFRENGPHLNHVIFRIIAILPLFSKINSPPQYPTQHGPTSSISSDYNTFCIRPVNVSFLLFESFSDETSRCCCASTFSSKLKNISYILPGVFTSLMILLGLSFHFLHDGSIFVSPNRVKSANTNCGDAKVKLRANGSGRAVKWSVVGLDELGERGSHNTTSMIT